MTTKYTIIAVPSSLDAASRQRAQEYASRAGWTDLRWVNAPADRVRLVGRRRSKRA